ncbi:MAG TPA: oxidoreductase, partial [Acidimicrobiia bacterium]|nr:oxidoreductase [Acidimicrobiia bacterium]
MTTRVRDSVSGALGAGAALAVSELTAGLVLSSPSLVEGLGNWVIDHVPAQVKEWAISLFGTNDKPVLLISIVAVTVLIGAFVGLLARDRFFIASIVFVAFGGIAMLAAIADPRVSVVAAAIPAVIAVVVGLATLRMLYNVASESREEGTDPSRRRFIMGAGAVVGIAALAG